MEIIITWSQNVEYPTFSIGLSSKPGAEAFLEVKGCRIATGKNGEFVAPPSTKGKNDKYWNHAYFSRDFAAVVLEKALEAKPKAQKVEKPTTGAPDDFDSDLPF